MSPPPPHCAKKQCYIVIVGSTLTCLYGICLCKIQFLISNILKRPCLWSPVAQFNVFVWYIKYSGNYPVVRFFFNKDDDDDDSNNNNNYADPDERSV